MGRVYRQQKREYNIGETMTQKRFIFDGLHVRDTLKEIPPIMAHNDEQRDKFLDGLNKLVEENKVLTAHSDCCIKANRELFKENNELRILVDTLKNQNQKFKARLKDLGVEYY